MRLAIFGAVLALTAFGFSDRFILSPLGDKIPFGTVKFEHLFEGGSDTNSTDFLGLGFSTAFDAEVVDSHMTGRADRYSLDLSYNVVGPVVDILPGVSFGVQDALNRTPEGRRFYWVTTYHVGLSGRFNSRTPMVFSLGASAGSRTGALFNVSIPFTPWFKLLSEFDTGRITHGIEYKPAKATTLRLLFRDEKVFWSASWSHRF